MMVIKLLGNLVYGLVFVISAPAGTGKTSLVEKLTIENPRVVQSVSFTTRSPRPGEIDGIHYFFISRGEFEKKIANNDFLEYVKLYNDYYGTSRSWVEEQRKKGKHVVLVIDTQGALQLKDKIAATYIFVMPPSMEELRRRLIDRNTESSDVIEKRLSWAESEMKQKDRYDYVIVNDEFNMAYETLKGILIGEERKKSLD